MRSHHLRKRRERLGLTQYQLAEHIGTAQTGISHCEIIDEGQAQLARYPAATKWIPKIRRMLAYLESKPHREAQRLRNEKQRIARQRALWAALPDHPAVAALKQGMIERCLDLMHNHSGEECDALAEFLPEGDVEAMFDQWWKECFPEDGNEQAHETTETPPGELDAPVRQDLGETCQPGDAARD